MATKKTRTAAPTKDAWAELLQKREAFLKEHKGYRVVRESISRTKETLEQECVEYSRKTATFKRGDRAKMIIRGVWQEVAVDGIHSPNYGYFLDEHASVSRKDLEPRYTVYQIQENGQPGHDRHSVGQSELVPLP